MRRPTKVAAPRLQRTPRHTASVDIADNGVKVFLCDVERVLVFMRFSKRLR